MLVLKILQFELPTAHSDRILAGDKQGFTPLRPRSVCCDMGHKQNNGLQGSLLASSLCGEGGVAPKDSSNQFHNAWMRR